MRLWLHPRSLPSSWKRCFTSPHRFTSNPCPGTPVLPQTHLILLLSVSTQGAHGAAWQISTAMTAMWNSQILHLTYPLVALLYTLERSGGGLLSQHRISRIASFERCWRGLKKSSGSVAKEDCASLALLTFSNTCCGFWRVLLQSLWKKLTSWGRIALDRCSSVYISLGYETFFPAACCGVLHADRYL